MDLQTLLDQVEDAGRIKPSRLRDIRSSVRRYAQALGCADLSGCYPKVYLLDLRSRDELIEKSLPDASANALRILKNNISFLLRQAEELKLIPLVSQHSEELSPRQPGRRRLRTSLPALISPKTVAFHREPYSLPLAQWPTKLLEQYESWKEWVGGTKPTEHGPDSRNRKATIENKTRKFEAFFGYLRNIRKLKHLDFEMLIDLDPPQTVPGTLGRFIFAREHPQVGLLKEFINWHERQRIKRRSAQAREVVNIASSVARGYYYPKAMLAGHQDEAKRFAQLAGEISKLRRTLDSLPPVMPQEVQRISREELLNAARQEFPSRHRLPQGHSGVELAMWAGRAVALMLLTRHPLFNKNYREAGLSRNIKQRKDGKWYLYFTGEDTAAGLRTEERQGKPNVYEVQIEPQIAEYLETYIKEWRPILVRQADKRLAEVAASIDGKNGDLLEKLKGYKDHLFLNTRGIPFTRAGFAKWIQAGTYRWLGVRVNPDMIRTLAIAGIISKPGEEQKTSGPAQ
jgi:hypothetical protein